MNECGRRVPGREAQPGERVSQGGVPSRDQSGRLSRLQGPAEKHILIVVKITVGITLLLKTK